MFYEREINMGYDKEIREVEKLLNELGLTVPQNIDYMIGIYYGKLLVATGSLVGNILQGIGVSPEFKEQGLASKVVTNLMKKAMDMGIEQLYIFTKPQEIKSFVGLGFKVVSIAKPYVALLEWGNNGIEVYKNKLSGYSEGKPDNASCIVVNCNPFTLGHRYLIETAARESSWVYILVVEEDKSLFPFVDRFKLIKEGTKDLNNITVIPGGKYVISSLTFPAYFTREEELPRAQAFLDLEIFSEYIAPALKVKRRYVGEEPYCQVTALYNQCMKEILPPKGIELKEIKRLEKLEKAVSASQVRDLIRAGKMEEIQGLVPDTTYQYLLAPDSKEVIEKIKNSSSRH